MTLRPLNVSFTVKWSQNDTWTEAYLGVRRLVYDILPQTVAEQRVADAALCQLALVGANHLVEVTLGQVLRSFSAQAIQGFTTEDLERASYYNMLSQWLPKMTGKTVDLSAQPFRSSEALRKRRNETVHKSSALATVQMARAALFSAVQTSQTIYLHTGEGFPYLSVLTEHPLFDEEWFSDVNMPPVI
ncbi:hypothetical protein [Halothiobacillus sp.]|uniref:hypothetical protein n=1 Tax=Halothiobacillus sp. TaxID=1891311 RepID=UPI0026267364|nr:hypothetical protein [Halothiobacillus sp.]